MPIHIFSIDRDLKNAFMDFVYGIGIGMSEKIREMIQLSPVLISHPLVPRRAAKRSYPVRIFICMDDTCFLKLKVIAKCSSMGMSSVIRHLMKKAMEEI